jgi:hypothetical protein
MQPGSGVACSSLMRLSQNCCKEIQRMPGKQGLNLLAGSSIKVVQNAR